MMGRVSIRLGGLGMAGGCDQDIFLDPTRNSVISFSFSCETVGEGGGLVDIIFMLLLCRYACGVKSMVNQIQFFFFFPIYWDN